MWDRNREQIINSVPRSVRHLYRYLNQYDAQLTDTLLGHLKSVAHDPSFEGDMGRLILISVIRSPSRELSEACFGLLLDMQRNMPEPNKIAELLIEHGAHHLACVMANRGMLPSQISPRQSGDLVLDLAHKWTYIDLLAPTLFIDPQHTRTLSEILFPRSSRTIEPDLMARITRLPMCEEARDIFTQAVIAQCKILTGDKRFARMISNGDGAVGGYLLEAGLLDENAILRALDYNDTVHSALSASRAWLLQRNTAQPNATAPKRARL